MTDNTSNADAVPGRMNGGQALARMLQTHEVGPMFGMGGFQLLPFYEAMRTLGLRHYLINDERSGCFAADAYARISGRPGVCDATLGPGATNLITAIVESTNAGIPQVIIVGDANREYAGRNMTQEARQAEILRPAAKELIRVETTARIPELVRRAFTVATSGRPGPVVLDVPEDVCHGEAVFTVEDFRCDPGSTSIPARRTRPDATLVEKAAQLIRAARRPLILVGGGIHLSGAYAALQSLAEAQSIPVAHSISGKGGIACTHPLSAGLFGRYSRIANDLIARSDLLIVVGCKLGEIATRRYQLLPPQTKIVHLDILAEEIGRTSRVDVPLWCDARSGLEDLCAALADDARSGRTGRADYAAEVPARMRDWLETARPRLESDERPINMARLIAELNTAMPADGILVADGGFAGHWTGLLFDTKASGRHFAPDRGFASIGYGLPGSIGAQLAAPGRQVVGITGDGGLNMTIGELETAHRLKLGFTLLVVNNAASGYVKALQHAVYGAGNYQSSDLSELDYAALARGFGCNGIRVDHPAKIAEAIRDGFKSRDVPTVVDVHVTRDPTKMLPAVDNRTLTVKQGDRPV
jgi:acetolactate synthase I/II/III large subunit